jgi:hypothetical protein
MPICKICNRELKLISTNHLKQHSISVEDYKKKYPKADDGYNDVKKKLSDKTKAQIKRDGHWAEGKTKKNSASIRKTVETRKKNHPDWFPEGHVSFQRKMSDEEKKKFYHQNGQKISATHKERGVGIGSKNSMYGRSVYNLWVEKYGVEEADRRKASASEKRSKSQTGKGNPMYGKPSPQGAGVGKRTKYNGITFRSTWEAKVAEWLDGQKITWKYEEQRYELVDKTYLPDFFVYEDDVLVKIIEVKGYLTEQAKDLCSELEQLINTPVEIWDEYQMKQLKLL